MRRVETRVGVRWRCLKSLAAAGQSRAARDDCGRARTTANQAEDRRRAEFVNRHRRRFP